eukprot:IDg15321t1
MQACAVTSDQHRPERARFLEHFPLHRLAQVAMPSSTSSALSHDSAERGGTTILSEAARAARATSVLLPEPAAPTSSTRGAGAPCAKVRRRACSSEFGSHSSLLSISYDAEMLPSPPIVPILRLLQKVVLLCLRSRTVGNLHWRGSASSKG